MSHWQKQAFTKLAGLGAAVFLPLPDGKYLLQEEEIDGKTILRPPGGGTEPKDKTLTVTIIREMGEEFALPAKDIKASLRFLGYEHQDKWWGSAIFELKDHGLEPGTYQASNDPEEKVKLVVGSLDAENYTGPKPDKLLSEAARDAGAESRDVEITKSAAIMTEDRLRQYARDKFKEQHGREPHDKGEYDAWVDAELKRRREDQEKSAALSLDRDEDAYSAYRNKLQQESGRAGDHVAWDCSCGAAVSRCRCRGPHDKVVLTNGCRECWKSSIKSASWDIDKRLRKMHARKAPHMSYEDWYNSIQTRAVWDESKGHGIPQEEILKYASAAPPLSGPAAIAHALDKLDLDKIEADAKNVLARKLKSKRPDAVKTLGYVQGFRRANMHPRDLLLDRIPVIPPGMRPFAVAGETFVPGDANELYRDLINVRDTYGRVQEVLGDAGAADARLSLYDAAKALYGQGEPVIPKTAERGVSGFLKKVVGTSPKFSFVQRKLLSKDVDSSGRSVVAVDPDLDMDQLGIPEEMAWKMYGPYIQRRLARSGMSSSEALRAIVDRSDLASKALDAEMPNRPLLYSRAPAWHKFSTIAGYGKRVKGNTIMVSPLVTTGMNMDFDGDTANLHVPSTPAAVKDAMERLLPSKMLFSIKDPEKVMAVPKQEFVLGLFQAQKRPAKRQHLFPDQASALKAIERGDVDLADEIEIAGPGTKQASEATPWVGFDLDGTLAYYTGWRGDTHIGPPIDLMVQKLREHLQAGDTCKIFTARADKPASVKAIKAWLEKHKLPALEVTNVKDMACTKLYDDRAVGVIANLGLTVG